MNWPILLYLTSLLLTCALTGFLALYAWQQAPRPGVRTFAALAGSGFLLALAEVLSTVSATAAQATFWFNLRFLFSTVMPVLWLKFALEYNGRGDWLSKRLLAALFIVPAVTPVLVWTNSLHGLWARQEAAFHQNGSLWIGDVSVRVPGIWFMVDSFYGLILLAMGIGVFLFAAWQRPYRAPALLLCAGTLTVMCSSAVATLDLFPQIGFSPFILGLGSGSLIHLLTILYFQFLKATQKPIPRLTRLPAGEKSSLAAFIFIFVLFASGIAAISFTAYLRYEEQFRAQVENQLESIALLKTDELEDWRSERLADASLFYRNPNFSDWVRAYFENPQDTEAREKVLTWMEKVGASPEYERIFLLDTRGVERLSIPSAPETVPAELAEQASAVSPLSQVSFLDFHRHADNDKIHLAVLTPIFNTQNHQLLGLLILRIDPDVYFYPFIQRWPVPSETGETLIVRREGESVLYLNPPRFQPDAALNLRIPIEQTDLPAVKAATGQTGVVEGMDYRGVPVAAAVHSVPGSPWFLVAKIDTQEVYAPLRERLWQTILFFGILTLATGTGLMLAWRQQRVRYYRAQVGTLEALRASEEKFRLAFDTSPDSIAITRLADGMFVSVNKGFELITGYTREEVIGKTSLAINLWKNPEDRRKIVEGLQANGEVRNYEAPFLTRNGEIYGLMSAAIIELDGVPHILNITRDITERKQAEEALSESENLYRKMNQNSPLGMHFYRLDENNRLIFIGANPAADALTGVDNSQFVGKTIEEAFPPLAQTELPEHYREAASKGVLWSTEQVTYDDRRIAGAFEVRAFQTTPGNMVAVFANITERKRAEQQLVQYTEKLEEMVDARTRELRAAQEQLVRQERLAILGQLAGSIGHELRNPLGIITNAVYILKMDHADENDPRREYLDMIENEARTADKIISELLDFTRLKSMDRRAVSASELIHQGLERYPVPPAVEVTLEIPADLPPVFADPRHIIQILGNFITNACQAMEEVGKLTLSAQAQGDMIAVAVQDTGVGIPPDHMRKLFEPLFTTKSKGIGLGLAVSRKLAEANGGRIEVQSEAGRGSTFTLFLPIHKELP